MMRNNLNRSLLYPFLISVLFLCSCKGQSDPKCLTALNEKISPHVNEKNKVGEVINLKDEVNCFEWDSLLIIMPMYLKNDRAEKELRIVLPKDIDYSWEPESSAMLLFLKNNKVVHSLLQKAGVSREIFDSSDSIKSYSFLELLNNYGKNSYYVFIPKEKCIFETYRTVYHDQNGKEMYNAKYALGIKVQN